MMGYFFYIVMHSNLINGTFEIWSHLVAHSINRDNIKQLQLYF